MADWDESADLVVIGFGGAGATAAITAADLGARVIVIDKQSEAGHVPSTMSSGGQFTVATDVEAATAFFDRCAQGMIPLEVSRAWVERAHRLPEWVERTTGLKVERLGGSQ